MRVSYEHALAAVQALLSSFRAGDIVLHIGMTSERGSSYTLETQAHRDNYTECDVDGRLPTEYTSTTEPLGGADNPALMRTGFPMREIFERWRANVASCASGDVEVALSDDAGRYLCEFIYYTSLLQVSLRGEKKMRVVFLHVPADIYQLGKIEEGRQITLALIRALVQVPHKGF